MVPFCQLLFRLDQANTASIPLVNNADIVRFFISENIKVVINVVQSKDRLLNGNGFAKIKAESTRN